MFRNRGFDFIRRVREELPWDKYAAWSTDELLGWLDQIEPGFLDWAKELEGAGK